MLNLPALLEHPLAREIAIGLIDGIALATVLAKPRRWRAPAWCWLVCIGGYLALVFWQATVLDFACEVGPEGVSDDPWIGQKTLCGTWTLAGLVCVCRAFENLRTRFENFQGESRQYVISDLLILAGVVALFAAGIRQTSLAQREPVFWAGMIFVSIVLPGVVVFLRVELSMRSLFSCVVGLAGATIVTLGLGWADSSFVQPGRISWHDALTRYGCLIAAMILPRILFQFAFHLRANLPSQSAANETLSETRDRPRDTAFTQPRELPIDEPGTNQELATEQTQPSLGLFA